VLLTGLFYRKDVPLDVIDAANDEYLKLIRRLNSDAGEHTFDFLGPPAEFDPSVHLEDHVHLTKAGYQCWAARLLPRMTQILDYVECWEAVFQEKPYCSLKMVAYLVRLLNIDYSVLFRSPGCLKAATKGVITREPESRLVPLWADDAGRCTSFALKVAYLLSRQYPGRYQFELFDQRHHRVAVCSKTAEVIDSSSMGGKVIGKVSLAAGAFKRRAANVSSSRARRGCARKTPSPPVSLRSPKE
jgi:hypothetical protein